MHYSNKLHEQAVTIFLLHGVIHEQTHAVRNYTKKHIISDFFYHFLKDLNTNGMALSMDEVIYHVHSGKPFPKNAFVITFDDGFENNYSVARPILKEFTMPATFYVTTDFIDNNRMSWIDRIEYAVELSTSGSVNFQLENWIFDHTIESKKHFLNQVRKELKNNNKINLDQVATDIQQQLGFSPIHASDDPLDKKMNWQQLSELANDPLCIVGGHTHTHPVLANLNDADSENEIVSSLKMLAEKINLKCTHYSYPEGLSNCYSDREINILKQHGIICCPSAEEGLNFVKSDLFHLKRIFVV